MNKPLKLDFNERCDNNNPIISDFTDGELFWQYPERQPLEARIAELNNLNKNQVLCTNGGDEAIMILMRIIKESEQLILPLPAFSQYTWGVESWGLDALLVKPKDNLAIDLKETRKAIKYSASTVTIVTRPNNPTGEMIEERELIKLINTSQENNGWVFLDEAYIEFSNTGIDAADLLSKFDNLVILRTLSKAFGLAGIRIGYLLGCEKLIAKFRLRCMPFNISTPSLQIATRALEDSNLEDVENYCQQIRFNRQFITDWLQSQDIEVFPSQANFIFLKLAKGRAKAIRSFFKKNNILVRTFEEAQMTNCLRITIPYNIEKLFKLLKQCLIPKLICMDMDGVLIDTSNSYDLCVLATVESFSGKKISIDTIKKLRAQGGFNNDWLLSQQLLKNLGYSCGIQEVTDVFQKCYLGEASDGLVKNELPLISSEFVEVIQELDICQFAIVTGRPKQEAKTGRTLCNLTELDLVSLDDVKTGKPSPEGIQSLQQKYSYSSWMCGDNPDDMQAAVGSNSLAVGIGLDQADALYDAGADIVIESINDLKEWMKNDK